MADRSEAARRAGALRSLIELTAPVEEAQAALAGHPPAAPAGGPAGDPEPAATLTRGDAVRVLDRYLAGEVAHEECVRWAAALRARRDLALERGHDDLLRAFLFEVASPHLFRPMSNRFAQRWRHRLSSPPLPRPASA
jgi:hypothetical protein